MDRYIRFNHREANFRLLCGGREEVLMTSIINNRKLLDRYISLRPEFLTSLVPLPPLKGGAAGPAGGVPEIALRMEAAARLTGLGPMASVAGGFAQMALEAAEKEGISPVVVENGGDVCLKTEKELILGLYAGEPGGTARDAGLYGASLAFRIPAGESLAVCSSSGTMGHSLSLGRCDLATVTAADGFLADSAATLAANLVCRPEDIQAAVERVLAVPGVKGVLIVLGDRIGMGGTLPDLVRNRDRGFRSRITRASE